MNFDCAYGLTHVRHHNPFNDATAGALITNFSLDYFVKGKIVQTYKYANPQETYDIDIRPAAADVAAEP